MHGSIGNIAENLSAIEQTLGQKNFSLVVAESCTGGMLASCLVDNPGASDWFYGSFVTYQARAKTEMLGVEESALTSNGLVSPQTAQAMACKALMMTPANYSIAVTGLAGPSGDGSRSHIGELWIAWGAKAKNLYVTEWFELDASRSEFRLAACSLAIEGFVKRFCQRAL